MSLLSIFRKDLHQTHLKVDDKAPAFKGLDEEGKEISLEQFLGKKVVLYFYPKDDTPGCTTQSCNLAENYEALQSKGYVVLGVSADGVKSHAKFKKKFNLPFQLIADEDKKIISAYDVWGNKFFMGRNFDGIVRTTFVISEKGIIEDVITKVDTKDHTAQIIK